MLGSCVLLAALIAAPALGQCPYNTTTTTTTACPTTTTPAPPQPGKYETIYVGVLVEEFMKKYPCDPYVTLITEVALSIFVSKYEDQYFIQNEIFFDFRSYHLKAMNGSQIEGVTVSITVTNLNNLNVIFEGYGIFIQVTVTAKYIVITISYNTIDTCSCKPVTDETVIIYGLVTEDSGNSTTPGVCSDCGDNTPPTCNLTTTTPPCDSSGDYNNYNDYNDYADGSDDYDTNYYPQYPPALPQPSGGCGCGCNN